MADVVFKRPPKGYRPKRDRTINAYLIVACPICEATLGQRCLHQATGKTKNGSHEARRRKAIRTMRERGEL